MTLLLEHWKPIVGYEEYYEVSNVGNVRKRGGKFLSLTHDEGYRSVELRSPENKRRRKIHRLVLIAFLGKEPRNRVVNHIDGIKHNNRLSNLEFTTPLKNNLHAIRLGLRVGVESCKLTEQQVLEIRAKYVRGSASRLGQEYGVSKDCINDLVRRKTWANI